MSVGNRHVSSIGGKMVKNEVSSKTLTGVYCPYGTRVVNTLFGSKIKNGGGIHNCKVDPIVV